jgi:tetratricopeptide (TPR) repeat protein
MLARFCVSAALVVATALVYAPVREFGFVGLDDTQYVAQNARVLSGLTLDGVHWAFTTTYFNNWHPLTWLSLMADVELFGARPGALHLVNVGLHALNSVLLFLLLARFGVWQSAFVAAVFCVHPLHVESVAWISERKDVLSAFFWITSTWAYVTWVTRGSPRAYFLALGLFALGLMTKPSLVTLPFALLLFDVWPLRRLDWSRALDPGALWRFVREKLPFFALSLASCFATLAAQDVAGFERLSLLQRIGNAAVSYTRYLGKTVWPAQLSVLYPHPLDWPGPQLAGSLLLLVAASFVAVRLRRRAPYALAGWLFFLGVLVPMIGLVQVGRQALADRYLYLPLIGLAWIAAWGAADLLGPRRWARPALAGAAALVLAAFAATSHAYVAKWRDGVSLFEHALASTSPNPMARWLYGVALLRAGESDAAIANLEQSLRLEPGAWQPWSWLGKAREQRGQLDAAERAYRRALELEPGDTRDWNRLARVLVNRGRRAEARAVYERTLREDPDDPEAWEGRAIVAEFDGEPADAVHYYREALRRQPALAHSRRRLGWILASHPSLGDAEAAVYHWERLCPGGHCPSVDDYRGLAAAYAAAGRREDAERATRSSSPRE